MDKREIAAFFDGLAPKWDAGLIHDDEKIRDILNYADIKEDVTVLDVACGTGVLLGDYLALGVKKVTGVDISSAMIREARMKFTDPRVKLINADIEETQLPELYERCVVYNAFPHFFNPSRLIGHLAGMITPGGRLTVAHSMSREQLCRHHSGAALPYSLLLPDEKSLSLLFAPYYQVDVAVSNDRIYVVSGVKKEEFV